MNPTLAIFVLNAAIAPVDVTTPNARRQANVADKSVEAKRPQRMLAVAESYTVYAHTEGDEEVKLHDRPIFRWANPEREGPHDVCLGIGRRY